MRVIRLLCLASLLALVVFSGTTEPSALADSWSVEEPPVATDAAEACVEDSNHQDSAGISITMTGINDDTEGQEREDTTGIRITMTGDKEEEDGALASVTLRARTGSTDGG